MDWAQILKRTNEKKKVKISISGFDLNARKESN